jgi:ABC-type transport system involved in cytochrome c biogenesis permease subunit
MAAWSMTAWTLVTLCTVSATVGFGAWRRPQSRGLVRAAQILGYVCLAAVGSIWLTRWWQAGHLPLFGTFESSLSVSVAVLGATAVTARRESGSVGLWPIACIVSAALLAHGARFDTTVFPLTISERSWIVDVHALLAWAAFGALAANTGFALVRLLGGSTANPRLDRRIAFTLSTGFMLHSAMLASGSFYKFLLFGRAWSFDPVETLGLVAWVSYGTLLHMHVFSGWQGRRLAAWCLALFLVLTASYRGIVYFPSWSTYHIFDMDLRLHVVDVEPTDGGGEP